MAETELDLRESWSLLRPWHQLGLPLVMEHRKCRIGPAAMRSWANITITIDGIQGIPVEEITWTATP